MIAVKVDENNIQKAKAYTALALEHQPSLIHAGFNTKMLLDTEVLLMQVRASSRCLVWTNCFFEADEPLRHEMS